VDYLVRSELLPSWAGIRPLALAVFRNGPRVLVEDSEAWDPRDRFYRPPGGGVEFGERAIDAVRREMREEFDAEIWDVRLLGTLESIFEYHGQPGHEIVLVFEARFDDDSFYEAERIVGREGAGIRIEAIWVDVSVAVDRPLYPEGLMDLL
jgi:ADP-ribose pyrophosphatase YjhB (NUDIX family)